MKVSVIAEDETVRAYIRPIPSSSIRALLVQPDAARTGWLLARAASLFPPAVDTGVVGAESASAFCHYTILESK